MEKKLKEQENPSKNPRDFPELNLYLENEISKLKTLQEEIIEATEEFLTNLNELSSTQIDLNSLFAAAFTMAEEILFMLGKAGDNQHSLTVKTTKKELENFKFNFNKEIISALNTQNELIQDNLNLPLHSSALDSYHLSPNKSKEDLPQPPELNQVDISVDLKINQAKKQYEILKDHIQKTPLHQTIKNKLIITINQSLKKLEIFVSNQQAAPKDEEKLNPLKESKYADHKTDTSEKDETLNSLINTFNNLYCSINAIQMKFMNALDKLPKKIKIEPPNLSEAVQLLKQLRQTFDQIILYTTYKGLKLNSLIEKFENLIIDSEKNFKVIGKTLASVYKTVNEDSLEISDETETPEIQNLITICELLKDLFEKFPHRGQQKHIKQLEKIIEELQLKIQQARTLRRSSSPESPTEMAYANNQNRFPYSSSSSSSSSSSTTTSSMNTEARDEINKITHS
ncbi:MAG TPA: hypothetical protein VHE99_10640 [Gammaproteobacteria bacterium]|nr:hypothetical protein [Gammaproteobacteria bacterium]